MRGEAAARLRKNVTAETLKRSLRRKRRAVQCRVSMCRAALDRGMVPAERDQRFVPCPRV